MAETKNTEKQNIEIQKEEEKRESVRKADAAVKSMHDFTSPEVLYQELIKSVKKYHPSTDSSHQACGGAWRRGCQGGFPYGACRSEGT